jgi:hypothetical protein
MNGLLLPVLLKRKLNAKTAAYYFLSILVLLLVLFIYLWYFKTSNFPADNNYYSQLAISFKKGQLYLEEKPSPVLLILNNPYNYQARRGIDFPWDASLYNGRFYLYWGPIPSLLLTLFDAKLLSKIGDQHLTFIFTCGLFLYIYLFSLSIWRRFFQKLPGWMFLIAIITVGIALPFTWILSAPRIYEASISSGQFFLIGGCYWAYAFIAKSTSRSWKLILTSLHWACAIGSRITLVPAVVFMIIMVLIKVARGNRPWVISTRTILTLVALILPIATCGIGLAWYNWARFGSIFEFGLRYQLTSTDYLNFGNTLFSTGNIAGNLYNYLTHTFTITSNFPYAKAVENIGTNERMVGLLFTVPFILLALTAPMISIYKQIRIGNNAKDDDQAKLLSWLILSVAGTTVINFAAILLYYYAATRFLVDVAPSLLLLSTIGFWRGYQAAESIVARVSFAAFGGLLATISIISSTLFSISLSTHRQLIIMRILRQILHLL